LFKLCDGILTKQFFGVYKLFAFFGWILQWLVDTFLIFSLNFDLQKVDLTGVLENFVETYFLNFNPFVILYLFLLIYCRDKHFATRGKISSNVCQANKFYKIFISWIGAFENGRRSTVGLTMKQGIFGIGFRVKFCINFLIWLFMPGHNTC
jgi:hypothetical protein